MSKLARNSAVYTAVLLLQKATGFFLLPLYTTYLSAVDYGAIAVVTSVMAVLSIVFTLSLYGAANRYYFVYREDPKTLRAFWSSLFWTTIINSAVLAALFAIFHRVLLAPFTPGIAFYPLLALGLVGAALNPAFLFFQTCLQARQEGLRYAAHNFAFFLLNVGLTIAFVVPLHLGAAGVLLALALTNIAFFLYTLFAYVKNVGFHVEATHVRTGLSYSLPLLPHALFGWIYATMDRVLLNRLRSTAEAGLYNVGSQFGLLIGVVTDSVNKAYAPWFFERLVEGREGKDRIVAVSSALVGAYAFLAVGLSLFSPELLTLMTRGEFRTVWRVIPPIAFGYVFGGVYYVVCNSLFIKRTKLVSVVTVFSAIASLISNLLLIPGLGHMGSAFACLLAQFVGSVLAVAISMKVEPIPYDWKKMYATIGLGMLVASCVYYLAPCAIASAAIKVAVLLGFSAVMALVHGKQLSSFFSRARLRPRGGTSSAGEDELL